MEKYHATLWTGVSLFVMILSYKMGLGWFRAPGPGLMPFLLGVFLLLISFFLLGKSLLKKVSAEQTTIEEQSQTNYRKIGLVLASLFLFALLLETLGYLLVTFLIFVILFKSLGNRWKTVLVASVLIALVTYFVFTFLGVRFPQGILGGILKL